MFTLRKVLGWDCPASPLTASNCAACTISTWASCRPSLDHRCFCLLGLANLCLFWEGVVVNKSVFSSNPGVGFSSTSGLARLNLISEGLYGNPKDPWQSNLNLAFRDFRAWCKNNKKYSSQRCFTVGMVSNLFSENMCFFIVGPLLCWFVFGLQLFQKKPFVDWGNQAEQQCVLHAQSIQWKNHWSLSFWSL